eukprot:CAMPEP_0183716304 /NCGR_PEP_ID=MMETSP0737-20130205/10270_1 /TAXON_ID=385413 /ORGANISM="Thalassiosira miniscula, Strain CCMP1093" /LENGTH=695 /DNA_ID=CAMNT_0025945555 /DNA_START=1 /DNA_END=2088 /DNA_ORIENTATION=+
MRALPPRSWKLAIHPHAPSPQVLAMAMLGGAGMTAGMVAFNNDDGREIVQGGRSGTSEEAINKSPPRATQALNRTPTVPRIQTMGASTHHGSMSPLYTPATQMLATSSSNILATSDASAERSASLAAAARLSRNPSAFSDMNKSVRVTELEHKHKSLNENVERSNRTNSNRGDDNDGNSVNNANSHGSNRDLPQPALEGDEDSYPIFTPYHHSLLKKYLTPEIWAKLSHLTTSYGTTIEDIIRAGLALPIGANPPRRVGVLVGDAECYTVFRDLLDPIISEYHGVNNYEEWMDPELPMERYFSEKGADASSVSAAGNASKSGASSITPLNNDDDDDAYGVIKSSGADDDSDEDDSSFLLDEEDDMFVEYVALPSTSTTPPASPSPPNNPQSATRGRVETIASKRKANLRRHSTIINNPRLVTNREADPGGKYIVSTRIRLARSLDGVKFPSTMSRGDRRRVQRLVGECTRQFQSPNLAHGTYLPVLAMSNDQNLDLIERHILFDNPNEWTIASGMGRDWPDGRALYANVGDLKTQTPDFMIWVNEEDHLRIMCLRNGGDIQGVFTTLLNGVRELERELRKRGWHFAYDSRLGYLTSCPTNVGTTMRASVHVRLTKLGRLPGFFELVQRLKLEARGKYGETDRHYTGVFDISNAERLGKSEVHLINVMVEGVAKLIELERRLEAGEMVNIDEIARA